LIAWSGCFFHGGLDKSEGQLWHALPWYGEPVDEKSVKLQLKESLNKTSLMNGFCKV